MTDIRANGTGGAVGHGATGAQSEAVRRILLSSSHASEGGVSVYLDMLARVMRARGWDAQTAALYRSPRPDPRRFDEIMVEVDTLGATGYGRAFWRFLSKVRREKPDVVLGAMPLSNVMAGTAALLTGSKAIATHHSPLETHSRPIAMLDRWLGSLGAYDSVICVSEAVARSFGNYPESYLKHLQVVANGVVPVRASCDRADIVEKYQLNPELPFIVMAGRFAPQKNPLAAIKAVSKVPGVQLVMAGTGPLRPDVEALIAELGLSDRVFLVGLLDRPDLHDLMGTCDAFMQVSLYEGQSLALLEAVSAGRPIIISDVPTQVESVIGADGGLGATICDPEDPQSIADAITLALFDDVHRARVSKTAQALAQDVRTDEQMQSDYAEYFCSIVGRTG